MSLILGVVFWRDDCNGGHYWIVITPPSYPEVLAVNFTSQGPRKDQSCVLHPGAHPVIRQETVVSFNDALILPTTLAQQSLNDETFAPHPDTASNDMLVEIWDGAYKTNRMTNRCRELLSQAVPN